MRIERNAQVTGASQSDEPANPDSPPALGTQNGAGLDNDQTQPSTEHLLADLFLMDPTEAEALVAQTRTFSGKPEAANCCPAECNGGRELPGLTRANRGSNPVWEASPEG